MPIRYMIGFQVSSDIIGPAKLNRRNSDTESTGNSSGDTDCGIPRKGAG